MEYKHIKKSLKIGAWVVVGAFLFIVLWGIFLPLSSGSQPMVIYKVEKGMGHKEIGLDLERKGLIKNHGFFTLYSLLSLNYNNLKAGTYEFSSSLSVVDITKKIVAGDVIKNNLTIIEGWDIQDIDDYLTEKGVFKKGEFLAVAKRDAKEGYLFPDTYQYYGNETPEELVALMLDNFNEKLTPELRQEIEKQEKSIFKVIIMASLLEKEVQTLEDKKIVAGILYKRIEAGVPLQVDATVNYVTGKHDPGVTIKDTTIDSPYNTYKYYGLPPGPISNPGLDSIVAAIYPEKSPYWYYLSDPKTDKTIWSKTLDEHSAAARKYLK